MLTDSENIWLKTRDKKRQYCFYCEALFGTDFCYWKCVTESCAMYPDMKDAALFEARVAAKLASSSACQYVTGHCMLTGCAACQLRDARLAVEEEMDAEV